ADAIELNTVTRVAALAQLDLPPDALDAVRDKDLQHCLLAPMVGRTDPVGVLSVIRRKGDEPFTDEDARLARIVANVLAVAVENDRLHALEAQQAAARERDRLARDLHDAVTQSIYSAGLIAEALPDVWRRDTEE